MQCVQSPLLLKEITTKVIDYFKQLSSQRGTTTVDVPAHLDPGAHSNVSSTPNSLPPGSVAPGNFFTCPPPKQLNQQTQATSSHTPQLYAPQCGAYPVMGHTNVNSGPSWIQPPRCPWPLQPTPQVPDNLNPYTTMTYPNSFPFNPMLTHSFGSVSSMTSQQQPQTQEQLADMISRFQYFGLHQEPPPQQNGVPIDGRLPCLSAQSASHPPPIHPSSTAEWYSTPASHVVRPLVSYSTHLSSPLHSGGPRVTQPDGQDSRLTGEFDLIERLINRTHSL